jgi:flagellar basal-body rod modification protein FlgD
MASISGLPNKANFQNQPVQDSPIQGPGSGVGGLLNTQKDQKASTEAEFGDVWKSMQARYGAKQEKPRTIKKQMDKDDFLKIMVTQMKNQDPMSPMKADQFATQLAQFTSVEQLQNLNQKMGQMTKANQPLERLAMTSLIGKIVTVDKDRFIHQDNEISALNYELPVSAKETKLTVINEAGEKIATRDLGPMKKGAHAYQWDGKRDDGQAATNGNYIFRIEGVDDAGKRLNLETRSQVPVVGISFESGEGVLLVGDVKNPTKTSMKNISRIDTMVRDMGTKTAGAPLNPLEENGVPAALQEKIMASLQQSVGGAANAEESTAKMAASPLNPLPAAGKLPAENNYLNNIEKTEEKGFPNGLSSSDNG